MTKNPIAIQNVVIGNLGIYKKAEDRILKLKANKNMTELRRFLIFDLLNKKGEVTTDYLVDFFFKGLPYLPSQKNTMEDMIKADLNRIRSQAFEKMLDKKTGRYTIVIDAETGRPILGKYMGVFIAKDRKGHIFIVDNAERRDKFSTWMETLSMRCLEREEFNEVAYKLKTYKNLPILLEKMKEKLSQANVPKEITKL